LKEIIELYNKGKTVRDLSKIYKMSPEEIRAILDEENIILRPESGNMRIFSKEEL